jgi:hypothetical protein
MLAIAIVSCVIFTFLKKPYPMIRPISLRVVEIIMEREVEVEKHLVKRGSYQQTNVINSDSLLSLMGEDVLSSNN